MDLMRKITACHITLWTCWLIFLFLAMTNVRGSLLLSEQHASSNHTANSCHGIEYVWRSIFNHPTDPKSYRHLQLENGLQVLLVHDASTEYAGAALDIRVGHFLNPEDTPGVAHFLEHLLFLGTEKYPIENDYGQFIEDHGGRSNAFTSVENTNYHFGIQQAFLEPALDRFAQFFIAPLFNQDSTEREREAVHSEYLKDMKNDARRSRMVRQSISNPSHPFHKFGTGNRDTLNGSHSKNIRSIVIEFYKKYYSSDIMKLVVYSQNTLDEMADMVVSKFSAITKSSTPISYPYVNMPVYLPELQGGKKIWIESMAPTMLLQLHWTLPDHIQQLKQKPLEYICYILDYDGPGGLHAWLNKHHLALSVDASYDMIQGATFFTIAIELTAAGLLNHDSVISCVFEYLQLMKRTDPSRMIFEDVQAFLELRACYPQTNSVMRLCSELAGNMHFYEPESTVSGPNSIDSFDPDLIRATLDTLQSDHCQLYILQNESSINAHYQITFPLTTAWYATKYEMQNINDELLTRLSALTTAPLNPGLALPAKNEFLRPSFTIHSGNDTRIPVLIRDDDRIQIYHRFDQSLNMPQSSVRILIQRRLLYEHLMETCFYATMASLNFALYSDYQGLTMTLYGYDSVIMTILPRVLQEIKQFVPTESAFYIQREQTERELTVYDASVPANLARFHIDNALKVPSFSIEDMQMSLPQLTYAAMLTMLPEIYCSMYIKMLVYGNTVTMEAQSFGQMLVHAFFQTEPESMPLSIPIQHRVVELPIDFPLPHVYYRQHPNNMNVVSVYYQTGQYSNRHLQPHALTLCLAQMAVNLFFDQMRTRESLGYDVRLSEFSVLSSTGLYCLVQSDMDPVYLHSRILQFFTDTLQTHLLSITEEMLHLCQQTIVRELQRESYSMKDLSNIYWHNIVGHDAVDFFKKKKLATMVQSITLAELQSFYTQNFIDSKRSLTFFASPIPLAVKSYTNLTAMPVSDILTLKSRLPLLPLC